MLGISPNHDPSHGRGKNIIKDLVLYRASPPATGHRKRRGPRRSKENFGRRSAGLIGGTIVTERACRVILSRRYTCVRVQKHLLKNGPRGTAELNLCNMIRLQMFRPQ